MSSLDRILPFLRPVEDLLIDGDGTPRPLRELLPGAFEEHDMEGRTT